MKAFCAVAPIPRQEDFGLADAVATLLRREGKFWYAEDSFLVQYKSRTKKNLKLTGPVFERWLDQDLSIFVGRVNLIKRTIELFTLGVALVDRRIHEVKGLVVWLMEGEEGIQDGVLNLKLEKPILKWSVADTENSGFTDHTYTILKQWLNLERWNRRYFRAGVAREIRWQTNDMPRVGEVIHTWTSKHAREALADIEPLVHLLGLHVRNHPELWSRVHAVEEALWGPDDPGQSAEMRHIHRFFETTSRLSEIARNHPTADLVLTVQILHMDLEGADFWILCNGRNGDGNSQRFHGTWEKLKEKGFDHSIEKNGTNVQITLSLKRHIASWPTPFEIIQGPTETPNVDPGDYAPCYFLRRLPTDAPVTATIE